MLFVCCIFSNINFKFNLKLFHHPKKLNTAKEHCVAEHYSQFEPDEQKDSNDLI